MARGRRGVVGIVDRVVVRWGGVGGGSFVQGSVRASVGSGDPGGGTDESTVVIWRTKTENCVVAAAFISAVRIISYMWGYMQLARQLQAASLRALVFPYL